MTEDLSLSSTLFRKEGTMLVTEEQINQFHEDGAILLKNAFRKIALIDPKNKILSTQVHNERFKAFEFFAWHNKPIHVPVQSGWIQ